jgi:hypothetical protein
VRLVRLAGAPEHEQEEGENGEERERPERVAPPRRRGPAAHRPLLVVLVPDAARAAAVGAEPAPRRGGGGAGAELVGEEEPARGRLPGVVHAGARAAVEVVVVERRLGRGGPGERHLLLAAGGREEDVRVRGGRAEHVVGRPAAWRPRRRGRGQARHVGVRLGVPRHHCSRVGWGDARCDVVCGAVEGGAQRAFYDEGFKALSGWQPLLAS